MKTVKLNLPCEKSKNVILNSDKRNVLSSLNWQYSLLYENNSIAFKNKKGFNVLLFLLNNKII